MSEVWVEMRGERDEGGYILGVYKKKPTPEEVLRRNEATYSDWEKVDGVMTWWDGCDWLTVDKWEVEP